MSKLIKRKIKTSVSLKMFALMASIMSAVCLAGDLKGIAQTRPTSATITASRGTVTCTRNLSPCRDRRNLPNRERLNVSQGAWAHLELRNRSSNIRPLIQAGGTAHPRFTTYSLFCRKLEGRALVGWGLTNETSARCDRITVNRPGTPTAGIRQHQGVLYQDKSFSRSIDFPVFLKQVQADYFGTNNFTKENFTDTQGHWAETAINTLKDNGIIVGDDGRNFRPDAPVTRAEFAAMLNRAFGGLTPIRQPRIFPDTGFHWGNNAIRIADSLEFISGYDDGNFRPDGKIIRAEAVVALASGLDLKEGIPLDNIYSDANQICGNSDSPDSRPPYWWACSQVSAASRDGIRIQGPESTRFNPSRQASRADIATFIYQALFDESVPYETVNITPATQQPAWAEVQASEDSLEVRVLGGEVSISPDGEYLINPDERKQQPADSISSIVSAGQIYTLRVDQFGNYLPVKREMTRGELLELLNSRDVQIFLDEANWSTDVAPQLTQFRVYRDNLIGPI